MSTPPPEQRIREHLERRGRPSNVELRRLLGTWRITDPTPEDRERVVAALEAAGLVVDPDITDTPLDAHVVVSIADAGTLARRARMREAAASERVARDAGAREAEAVQAREAEAAQAREAEAARAREAEAAQAREEARRAQEAERAREEEQRAREAERARAEAERTRSAEREREAEEARATAIADEARRRAEREEERRRARERDEREREVGPRAGKATAGGTGERVWMEDAFDERPATEGATLADLDPVLDDPAEEEPVEVPESFARSLLTAGAVFLAIALVVPWYKGRRGGIEVEGLENAWEWLGVLDVLIVLLILGASAVILLRPQTPTPARVVTLAAVITLISVAYRVGAPPDDVIPGLILEVDLQIGPFVALIGCALVVCGAGLLAKAEELPVFAERGARPPLREPGDDGARTASD